MSGWLLWTMAAFGADPELPPPTVTCPAEPLGVVRERELQIEDAYITNDLDAFDVAAEHLASTIGCIDEPIDPATAVGLHHAMGLRAFVSRDPASAARSLRAVRLLDPQWRPRADWMREGQPLYALYLEYLPPSRVTLPPPGKGAFRVDGRETAEVPANEAFVLQHVDARKGVVYTGYHASVATVPDFADDRRIRGTVRAVGTSLAVALLGGSVLSEIASANASTALYDPSTPPQELTGLLSRTNSLRTVAVGLGVGSVVTAGLTWAVPW
jgi:hypothetical protein